MGGQQPREGSGTGDAAPTAKAVARAQKRADRQRRAEERRRRWAPQEPVVAEVDTDAAAAGTDEHDEPGTATTTATTTAATTAATVPGGRSPTKGVRLDTVASTPGPSESPSEPASSSDPSPVDASATPAAGSTAVLTRSGGTSSTSGGGAGDDGGTVTETVTDGREQPGRADAVAPTTAEPAVPARGPMLLWQLVLAAHPRQALVVAAAFAGVAALAGRSPQEIGLLAAMALVGQTMLGWHNDLVDRDRDAAVLAHARDRGEAARLRHKPLAEGRVEPGTVWYVFALALLLLVPLSISSGVLAGAAYLVSWSIGLLGNIFLRGGWLSWLPWAASYALYPAVLSYAGPTGGAEGGPPQPALVALAAALGLVVHVLRALPGLVDDNREGQRHVALRVALRTGAPRLLGLAAVLAVGLVIALVTVGSQLGLVR